MVVKINDDGSFRIQLWPDPVPPWNYGSLPKQKLLFIEDLPDEDTWLPSPTGPVNIKRPHYHPVDVLLYIGGGRSGKTLSTTARVIDFLFKNPKSLAIIGAESYKQLQRTALKEWETVFTHVFPWDIIKYKNSPLIRKPNYNDQRAVFSNGSEAKFIHFSEADKIKGINASIVHVEEADMLPDEEAFEELLARLSNLNSEIRQIILTTNPLKARKGWIKEKFKLQQLDPNFKGEIEPIVPPCKCQICPTCLKTNRGEWLYLDSETKEPSTKKGSVCSNPDCPVKIALGTPQVKDNNCPGNQVYYRIIETSSADNPHKPSDYESSAAAGMSAKTAAAMIGGKAYEDREGEVYQAFGDLNVLSNNEKIDLNKDLVWSLDFNYDPQCSVVCQEFTKEDSFYIQVLDEIVMWNALPEHAAKEFCKRYHFFKGTDREVLVFSDPAGLWGGGKDLKPTYYKTIIEYLRAPTNEFGEIAEGYGKPGFECPDGFTPFKVRVMMQLDKRSYKDKNRVKVKVPLADSIQALNHLLCNEVGESKIFVNPKCKYLILSLDQVKWDSSGQDIDKSVDRLAAKKRDNLRVMTHPSDALRYYVYKRFPLIKQKRGIMIIQSPGKTSSIYREGKVEDLDRKEMLENLIEEKRKAKEEKKKLREEKKIERQKRLNKKTTKGFLSNIFGNLNPFRR